MLKNAMLYKEELLRKYQEVMYDLDYIYYSGGTGNCNLMIPENTYEKHCFASVDKNDNVIGYIAYNVDFAAKSCYNFGAISFERGNVNYTKDLLRAIDDIFRKYKMNRLDFYCILDNPIRTTYQKLIEKYGGRVVGVLEDNSMLLDGKIHSSIMFELKAMSYLSKKGVKF